ncbi:hypothetical protein EYF80_039036 [Liparis tanakae]|uniref:Uncharacterized protein n=1 Tax=Liparis tanakae TaxID=230148 RepID=A0A4Z2GC07_9TELE|nr:hypothetical protein EYF80_039036 [Liparis tanakae]
MVLDQFLGVLWDKTWREGRDNRQEVDQQQGGNPLLGCRVTGRSVRDSPGASGLLLVELWLDAADAGRLLVKVGKCSLMESCTSVGMSGDVRLIFTAASRKPIEPMGSFTFSVAMMTGGCCWGLGGQRGGWSGRRSSRSQAGAEARARDGPGGKRALVRRGARLHSFQEMNVRRPSRARPQSRNTQRRRPNEAPGGEPREPRAEHHTRWTNRW